MAYQNGKKAIIIRFENKPIFIFHVEEINSHEFLVLQKECKKNLDELLETREKEKEELNKRIANLEKEIKIIKGED